MRKSLASVCLTLAISFSAMAAEGIIYTEKNPPPPPPPVAEPVDTETDTLAEITIDLLAALMNLF